jgi:error-prone DNA polymerase
VHDRFGRDRAALVAAFPTFRARGAIRELGKALGLPPGEIERVARGSEGWHGEHVDRDIATALGAGREAEGRWSWLGELAEEAHGLPRHLSQHSGGMIVATRPLIDCCPVVPAAMEGRQMVMWDKDSCSDAGFLKIDLLGLGMLSSVERCVELIAARRDERIDLSRIPYDDPATFKAIQEAETTGVFQIESRAQMGSLRRTRPENLDDLTVQVAIVRPGPIQGGAVNPYIERRQRLREEPDYEVPYDHPSLEPVLRDTLGTIIFQDQVIEVSMAFSGFSPGEAEGLRRAMSRKRSAEAIEVHHRSFVEGAMAKWPDVDEALAERVWSMVVGFSGFGFPKAHGAAFGLLAYQSTWLRVHYGPEFLCSLLDEQPMGFYPPDALIHEAQRRGIEILPPDVNASAVGCTVVDVPAEVLPFRSRAVRETALVGAIPPSAPPIATSSPAAASAASAASPAAAQASPLPAPPEPAPPTPLPVRTSTAPARAAVRLGLGYVLGVRGDEVTALVEAREAGGHFRSLDDLAARAGAGRPALAQLAWSGACDALAGGRRPALWRLGAAVPPHAAGAGGTQLSLGLELPAAPELAPLDDWDAMIADYATIGLTVDRHPLRLLREGLSARGIASSADLGDLPHGAHVRVGGIVVARQRPGTAKGVVFLLLEDETGTLNVIIPPKVYARDRLTVRTEPLVVVEGVLERFASAGGAINLLVKRIAPLDAPDLLSRRPHAQVKDFSMLDARELARIALEQPRVAAAAAGGATAAHVRPAASAPAAPAAGRAGNVRPAASSPAPPPASGPPAHEADEPDEPLPASGTGAEDFRAVAPPIMSFAQGRRR